MAGLGVKLFTDEMIDPALATVLESRGYDALSCQAAGRSNQRIPDHEQLPYAAMHGRALATFDVGDYSLLDVEWKLAGRRHAGIVLIPRNMGLSELIRCIQRHLDRVEPSVQDDTLLWRDTSRDF